MDPLVQIEWIAAGSAIIAAFGAGSLAAVATVTVSIITGRQALAKQRLDYARQDQVAERLMESNKRVAATAAVQIGKLDVIHTLVNSDLTKAIQGHLDEAIVAVSLADQVVQLHRKAGVEAPSEVLGIIDASNEKIAALRGDLAQRAKQQSLVEQKENASEAGGVELR